MKRKHWLAALAVALAVGGGLTLLNLPAAAPAGTAGPGEGNVPAPPEAAKLAALPIKQVVLFNSGMGYFQREGTVEGDARVDLQFQVTDINDLLKSLVLQDFGGGQVGAVSYDSHDPVERTLASFAVNLTGEPGVANILHQARGEKVEVLMVPNTTAQPATLTGAIVGVEKQKVPGGKDSPAVEVDVLTMWCADGLRSVKLSDVQRLRFLNPSLESEVRRALEVLTTAHDSQKKAVSLNFTGEGKRPVKVSYVVESPVWKTSYRLVIGKEGKPYLQGWAIVENPTDEDWNGVRMALVSGRPISFRMDLYQPLYAPRPLVEPELFASLRPPSYSGAMDGLAQKPGAPAPMAAAPGMGGGPGGPGGMPADEARRGLGMDRTAGAAGFGGGAGFGPANGANRLRGEALAAQRKAAASFATSLGDKADLAAGVASAANAEKLGDAFQYVIEHPVNLPRQKSALLPIVGKEVEGERVSIYNPSVHAKFPLLGLRFKNTTGLPLMQGPVTVLDGSVYAGDARLPDLQANEDRLLAYAVDLGTEVQPVVEQPRQRLTSVKVHRGLIQTNSVIHEEHTYKLANRSDKDRTVLVEHPYRPEFKLVPEQKVETTREVYRFPVAVKSGQSTSLKVIEERDLGSAIAISNTDDNTIRMFINGSVATAKVKETLAEAIKRKEQVAQVSRELAHTRDLLKTVSEDQSRLRANLKETPPNTELSKRTQDKILKEDTEIDELNAKIKTLQEREYAERKSFEDYLVGLNVE